MDISTSAVIGGAYRRDTTATPIAAPPLAVRPRLATAVAAAGRGEKSTLDSERRFRGPRENQRDGSEEAVALRPESMPGAAPVPSQPSSGPDVKHRVSYKNGAYAELSGVLGRADDEERLLHFPPESLVRYLEAVAERKEASAPIRLERKVDTRV